MDLPLTPTRVAALLALAPILACLPACSDSDSQGAKVPQKNFSTDSLDDLAPEQAAPPEPPAEEPVVIDQSAPAAAQTEQEREWERERQSQSNYGRTRDRVKTLTNRMQDGAEAEDGLADVRPDEEWAGTHGVRWDMPADWRMAVPSDGRFGQMHIPSQLGAASVAFTRESGAVSELERRVSSMLVDMTGGRVTPRVTDFDALGRPVKMLSSEGSLLDPSGKGGTGETPYQAVRAGIVDLGDTRVLILMWGPEDTVRNHEDRFEAMLRSMSEQ